MDPREYRDARWYSLLREAEDLGVAPEDAPQLVERVLGTHERRIRRAADPDPLVRAALHEAVAGPRPTPEGRGRRILVVGAALALLVGAGTAYRELTRPDPPQVDRLADDQLPSLFGYDGPTAERLLTDRGLKVTLQPFQACEIQGRVIGAEPATGSVVEPGERVTVFTAIPSDITCLPDYNDRELAWRWLDFAAGRATAPPFARRVQVHLADGTRTVLTRSEAADPATWSDNGVFAPIVRATQDVSMVEERPLRYAVPTMRVVRASEGVGSCGVPPSDPGTPDAIAVLVGPADRSGCPLRVELDRGRAHRITGVAVYRTS